MTYQPISLFDTIEPDIIERLSARKHEIDQGASVNSKIGAALALGSLPIALAALSSDVYGQSSGPTGTVLAVLQFALILEYLEAAFYARGVTNFTPMSVPSADQPIFTRILNHENAHVQALSTLLGSNAPTAPTNIDFTAGGTFSGFNFTQYATFQTMAQAFEDTGVRAYKGQAPNLMGSANTAYLTGALSIHAVEAEHASEIRRLRNLKGWITGNGSTDLPSALSAAIYAGEANTVQGDVDVSQLSAVIAVVGAATPGGSTYSETVAAAATEAFDEPLAASAVIAIVAPFLPGYTLPAGVLAL